jgi:hypothetical protein
VFEIEGMRERYKGIRKKENKALPTNFFFFAVDFLLVSIV